MHKNHARSVIVIGLLILLGSVAPSRAQGYVSPLIGYDFGGNAGCPNISNCTDKRSNIGVAFGSMGKILGFEEEFADAKNFFGEVGAQKSSVLTAMTNISIVPALGPIHPYALFGLGVMKTHVDFDRTDLATFSNTGLAWDTGIGATVLFGGHFGVRADLRHFHSTKSMDIPFVGTTPTTEKISFGRVAGALVLAF